MGLLKSTEELAALAEKKGIKDFTCDYLYIHFNEI